MAAKNEKVTTGPIRALPDDAPEPKGRRIPYTCSEWIEVIALSGVQIVWWRGNFYEKDINQCKTSQQSRQAN